MKLNQSKAFPAKSKTKQSTKINMHIIILGAAILIMSGQCIIGVNGNDPNSVWVDGRCNVQTSDDLKFYHWGENLSAVLDNLEYTLVEPSNFNAQTNNYDYYTKFCYDSEGFTSCDQKAYAHASCITGLGDKVCASCIAVARDQVEETCKTKVGGMVQLAGCFVRFECYPIND